MTEILNVTFLKLNLNERCRQDALHTYKQKEQKNEKREKVVKSV